MKKKLLLLLFIGSITYIHTQEKIKGNKNVTVVKTNVNAFKNILVKNSFEVSLSKASYNAVEIETDENLHDIITTSVIDSTLTIFTDKKIRSSKKLNITVFYNNDLKKITATEDAEIISINTVTSPNLAIEINDYAKVNISLNSDNFTFYNNNKSKINLNSKSKLDINSKQTFLKLKESSNSDIIIRTDTLNVTMQDNASTSIEGFTNTINSTTTSSSNFKGKNLNTKISKATVKDNSNFTINVSERIDIEASEKSETDVYGNGKIILVKFTNSSKLFKKEI